MQPVKLMGVNAAGGSMENRNDQEEVEHDTKREANGHCEGHYVINYKFY